MVWGYGAPVARPNATVEKPALSAEFFACAVAVCAVLPVFAPTISNGWNGLRLATSDSVLGGLAPTELPLSVRSPGGVWAAGLVLAWFSLGYSRRRLTRWETGLVVGGVVAALVRAGNTWIFGLAMVAPLGRQLAGIRLPNVLLLASAAVALGFATYSVASSGPPALPTTADQAALAAASTAPGTVFADWRWAGALQRQLGSDHAVLAANGFSAEPGDFLVDYVHVVQGQEGWADVLRRRGVDVVVLDAAGQGQQAADLVRSSTDWHVLYDADGVLVADRVGR
jgi:hypothetical protein